MVPVALGGALTLSGGPAGAGVPVGAVCVEVAAPGGCDPLPPAGKQQTVNQSRSMSPAPGDYDGDGLTDVIWTNLEFGQSTIWWATGAGAFAGGQVPPVPGTSDNVGGDFDGDGANELLWYDGTYWDFTGRTATELDAGDPLERRSGHVGDFDGDGTDDVLWFSPSLSDEVWFGGPDAFTVVPVAADGVYVPHVGDFDGDGRDDVFWDDPSGTNEVVWYGRDRSSFDAVPFDADWPGQVDVVGDQDGNGTTDLLFWWRQGSSDVLWYGQGREFRTQGSVHDEVPPFGVDLDGDGYTDLIWSLADVPRHRADIIKRNTGPDLWEIEGISVIAQYLPIVGEFGGTAAEDVLWVNHTAIVDPVWWS